MSRTFDITLQSAERQLRNLVAAFLLCIAALSAAQASAGQPGRNHVPDAFLKSAFIAKPIAGPILDPKLASYARPVMDHRSIPSAAPQPVALSPEQALKFIATRPRPPETGPLADLFRSARPIAAPEGVAPPPIVRDTDINIAGVPAPRNEIASR